MNLGTATLFVLGFQYRYILKQVSSSKQVRKTNNLVYVYGTELHTLGYKYLLIERVYIRRFAARVLNGRLSDTFVHIKPPFGSKLCVTFGRVVGCKCQVYLFIYG